MIIGNFTYTKAKDTYAGEIHTLTLLRSKVAFRPVRLGGVGEETAAIVSGLQPGDRFVAMGAHLLRAGEQVRAEPLATAAR